PVSRIGKMPVAIPSGVEVRADGEFVRVKGPRGELSNRHSPGLSVAVEGGEVRIARQNDEKQQRAFHGLLRSLVANSVNGVTKGFTRDLEIVGVGYRAEVKGKPVVFSLGYSHPIQFPIPEGISVNGVTKGFTRDLEIVGVGYRAEVKGKPVVFSLGYSHPIQFPIPEGISI